VAMLCDVIKAEYLEEYKLKIEFEDGCKGIVDFLQYCKRGGVFSKFQDLNFFTQFTVSKDLGTIVWGNEIDIAPETVYEKCEQNHCT
jgi:hypothetical protein